MATCDVCSAPASRAKNPVYTADEIRQLVSNGFELDESTISTLTMGGMIPREQVVAQWGKKVAQTDTEWLLCPDCAGRAARYRELPKVETSRWRLVGALVVLAVLVGAAALVIRAPKTKARSLRDSLGGVTVTSVAFSPDGRFLATGRDDLTVKLWDVATGQEMRTLSGHKSRITDVAFSPDGRLFASTSNERRVKLWDVATGQEARIILGEHTLGITSVDFAPDGKTLASGSHDNTIKLWDISTMLNTGAATGQEVRTLSGHTSGVISVAFSPDGRLLASGSNDKTIKLWDVATGQVAHTLSSHDKWVHCVSFSPDGQTLASGSDDGTIKLWDVKTGRVIRTLDGHTMGVASVAFSPDGRTLASGSDDGTVKLWDVLTVLNTGMMTEQEARTLSESKDNRVTSVAFSPDGLILASGNTFDTKLWDME